MEILQLFANPALLTAGILAAAPIVIHLLSRLRAREMDFPTLRFLRKTTEKTSRRRRIENWLLLVLRTLALLMLTLAAAGPVLPGGSFFGGSGISSVILFDDSLSTDREDFRINASQALRETVRNLPSSSQWTLRTNCRYYDGSALQRLSTHSAAETTQALKVPAPTAAKGELSRRTAEALAALSQNKGRSNELIIITDGQLSEWDKLQQYCSQANLPDNLRIYLFSPQIKNLSNFAPADMQMQLRLPLPGEKVYLKQPYNYYGTNEFQGTINCFFNQRKQSGKQVSLSGSSSGKSELSFTLAGEGWQDGFTIASGDNFTADNKRYFAVKIRKQLDVLLLGEGEYTFDTASIFLKAALAPLPNLPIKISVASQQGLAPLQLDDFSAIFTCFDSTPSQATVEKLCKYVKNGGILIVFPGSKMDVDAWNNIWNTVDNSLITGKLSRRIDFTKNPCGIQMQANAATFFPDMNSQNFKLLNNVKILKAYNIDPQKTDASEILTLFNSLPFTFTQNYGKGKFILFSSPPINEWGLLQARPVFVPLMLSFLKMGPVTIAEQSQCGLPLNLIMDTSYKNQTAIVTYPDKHTEEIKFPDISPDNPAKFWNTMQPGIYQITFPKIITSQKSPLTRLFAINPATGEGDLTAFEKENLPALDKYGKVYFSQNTAQLAAQLNETRKDLSLKLPLEIIVLLLLAAEGIIGLRRAIRQNQ